MEPNMQDTSSAGQQPGIPHMPPQPTAPQKKPFYKKVWFWLLVILVLLFTVIGGCSAACSAALTDGPSAVSTSTASSSQTSSKSEAAASKESPKEESPEADYSDMSIGDTVTLDDGLEVTVTGAKTVTAPYTKDTYTRVTVSYVNNGEDSARFNMWDWAAEDKDGAQRDVTIYLGEDDNRLDSGNLKPGGKVKGTVYFEGSVVKAIYNSNIFSDSDEIAWNIK